MSLDSAEQLYTEEQAGTTSQLKMNRQLVMLHSASCNISATLETDQVVGQIVQEFSNILAASSCYLGLWNGESNQLEVVVNHRAGVEAQGDYNADSILAKHPFLTEKILETENKKPVVLNFSTGRRVFVSTMLIAGSFALKWKSNKEIVCIQTSRDYEVPVIFEPIPPFMYGDGVFLFR